MSMNKEEFFDILREYASKEFEHIPQSDDEIDYEFSEEFEKKMEKLIDSIGSNNKPRKITRRKAIAILIAAIIVLFAGVMSVGAVREAIVSFVYEKIGENYEITFEDDVPDDKLDYIYSFSVIPEGFVETERLSEEAVNYVRYDNKQNNHCITLSQEAIGSMSSISMDGENGHIEKYDINGTEINIYISDRGDAHIAYWIWGYNYIELVYHGETTNDEILELIKTIS